ncbi:MAG: TadE/TadG family type IV pilus assembly protein [Planctomycetota bacterium]
MKNRKLLKFWRERSGQTMVEFALAFPLQLVLVFGLMQLALLAVGSLTVNYTAYRCARAAMVGEHRKVEGQYVITSTGQTGDTYRGVDKVAQLLLAPLASRSTQPGDQYPPTLTIPGRGEIRNSDVAAYKTRVLIDEPAVDDPSYLGPEIITATVEFNQQIAFPFIDSFFRFVCRDVTDGSQPLQYAFGELDSDFNGSPHFGDVNTADTGRGRIRIIGGQVHYVITRSCTLYKGTAMEVPE